MSGHQRRRRLFFFSTISAAMSVLGVHGATASATDKQSEMSIGAFVMAPGCIVSLGQDGSVTENCDSVAGIIRQDLSHDPAFISAAVHNHGDREASRTVVTVVY